MTCHPLITHHNGRDTARAHTFGDTWDDDT